MINNRQRAFTLAFNVFTIVLWGWMVLEFLTKAATIVPGYAADTYLLVLVYYAGDKEIRRWRHTHRSTKRRGEMFVFGWILTIVAILGFLLIGGKTMGYELPHELPLVASGVVVVYFVTEYLKSEYRRQ